MKIQEENKRLNETFEANKQQEVVKGRSSRNYGDMVSQNQADKLNAHWNRRINKTGKDKRKKPFDPNNSEITNDDLA